MFVKKLCYNVYSESLLRVETRRHTANRAGVFFIIKFTPMFLEESVEEVGSDATETVVEETPVAVEAEPVAEATEEVAV